MKSLISLEEFKGLSEEDMIKEVEKVLPLLSPLCQVRAKSKYFQARRILDMELTACNACADVQ